MNDKKKIQQSLLTKTGVRLVEFKIDTRFKAEIYKMIVDGVYINAGGYKAYGSMLYNLFGKQSAKFKVVGAYASEAMDQYRICVEEGSDNGVLIRSRRPKKKDPPPPLGIPFPEYSEEDFMPRNSISTQYSNDLGQADQNLKENINNESIKNIQEELKRLYSLLSEIPNDINAQEEFYHSNISILANEYLDEKFEDASFEIEYDIFSTNPNKLRNQLAEEMKQLLKNSIEEAILQREISLEELEKSNKTSKETDRKNIEEWELNNSHLTDEEYEKLNRESKEMDKVLAEEIEDENDTGLGITWDWIELEGGDGFAIELDENGNPIKKQDDSKGWGGQPERGFDTPWKT